MESENLDSFLLEKFIEMTFDLEAKSVYTFKRIGYYRKKTLAKYLKVYVTLEPIWQTFTSSYLVESDFSSVCYIPIIYGCVE